MQAIGSKALCRLRTPPTNLSNRAIGDELAQLDNATAGPVASNASPITPKQHWPATTCHDGQATVTEEQPIYVNEKQLHRILKGEPLETSSEYKRDQSGASPMPTK
ncbi:hypothetical protein N657DRAFT_642848 [Parathielavia appendiculata]|uniref:Uncharacterized protein n=1 Tax=Parathielavia appendiculata TaxID=2587402 RepID=A0AAN6U4E7_9PEZI|nr:hypothetical protein N657DRAFT_642848 [Parathielavia appendiculata]